MGAAMAAAHSLPSRPISARASRRGDGGAARGRRGASAPDAAGRCRCVLFHPEVATSARGGSASCGRRASVNGHRPFPHRPWGQAMRHGCDLRRWSYLCSPSVHPLAKIGLLFLHQEAYHHKVHTIYSYYPNK
ncbi:hypothetical protein BDA96_04G121300 [Sorghum bicolor]|uniref:Uncharacterized protein n=2 Tax=Sorghum bicolor TaxID=4558 RepID=A0A921UK00_SORBI|nr:hypothetical protein BDA96_10G350300 [Sorghum bicolor]KAG0532601.1 hypothetical protein BDA96_04G121300 [Sorghum bicolor]KXG29942.1 hypothetical protein SORBI_3004G112600 [Sorghum bicolor]KXG29943.1 hypothetical protein SORBI_3004G112600 [Sorghum bicolor]